MATYGVHAIFVFERTSEPEEEPHLWAVVSDLDLVAATPVVPSRDVAKVAARNARPMPTLLLARGIKRHPFPACEPSFTGF